MNKEEYAEYLKSDHWKKVREAAIDRAVNRCQLCGESCDKFDVHHNTYDNLSNEEDRDVIALCRDCHSLYHVYKGKLPGLDESTDRGKRSNFYIGILNDFRSAIDTAEGMHPEYSVEVFQVIYDRTIVRLECPNPCRHVVMDVRPYRRRGKIYSKEELREIELESRALAKEHDPSPQPTEE